MISFDYSQSSNKTKTQENKKLNSHHISMDKKFISDKTQIFVLQTT